MLLPSIHSLIIQLLPGNEYFPELYYLLAPHKKRWLTNCVQTFHYGTRKSRSFYPWRRSDSEYNFSGRSWEHVLYRASRSKIRQQTRRSEKRPPYKQSFSLARSSQGRLFRVLYKPPIHRRTHIFFNNSFWDAVSSGRIYAKYYNQLFHNWRYIWRCIVFSFNVNISLYDAYLYYCKNNYFP